MLNAPFMSPKRPEQDFFLNISHCNKHLASCTGDAQRNACASFCKVPFTVHFCVILTIFGICKIILGGKTFLYKISRIFFHPFLSCYVWTDRQTHIPQSILRQVHTLCQSDFFTHCDLALSLSISSILYFP